MPGNACFATVGSIGVPRLRRVLRALAWLYPEIGYCQGTGMVSSPGGRGPQRCLQVPREGAPPSRAEGREVGVPEEELGCQTWWFQP